MIESNDRIEPAEEKGIGPGEEQVRRRAYERYAARGTDGYDVEDWLAAEEELRANPITTAEDEARVRGAEAEAAEEKREAEAS